MRLIEDLGMLYPTEYSNKKERYSIYECPTCGKHFKAMTKNVTKGRTTKCRSCASKITSLVANTPRHTKTKESYLLEFARVHGDRYDYSKFMYEGSLIKSVIGCSMHGDFLQTYADHRGGHGCPKCQECGFNQTKSAILYYLKISIGDLVVYKIGITNRTVQERFNSTDLEKIQVLKTWDFPLGADAYNKEQEILKLHKEFKYTGEPLLSSGNTELFIIDVLGFDTQ